MNIGALDNIYTAAEAAERLRLTTRGVIKLGREHGLCSRRGRDYLFSEADLLALWEIMREPPREGRSSLFTGVRPPSSDLRLARKLVEATAKKKGTGRKRWEATHEKNTQEREATKAAVAKWKDEEPLDPTNRDPAYWTPERKERRRLEYSCGFTCSRSFPVLPGKVH
jgi:hypothetical protein